MLFAPPGYMEFDMLCTFPELRMYKNNNEILHLQESWYICQAHFWN